MVKWAFRNLGQLFSPAEPKQKPEKPTKKSVASGLSAYNLGPNANESDEKILQRPEAARGNVRMNLRSFGITDVGLKRTHNEDNFYRSDELGMYLVADGMGGHAAGEVASNTSIQAVAAFAEKFSKDKSLTWPFGYDTRLSDEQNVMVTGIQLANQTLCKMQQEQTELNGMGTTLVALRITGDQALIAHVGDSRVYRMRGETFELLTSDHSWVNEQLLKNIITAEEARTHRYRNVITRALGNRTELEIDVRVDQVEPGDSFLLCSDGLSGMMEDSVIEEVMRTYQDSIRQAANTLVARANEAGGHDNISVVIVSCSAE